MIRSMLAAAVVAVQSPALAVDAASPVAPAATCSHVTIGRAVLQGGPHDVRRVAQSAITVVCDPRVSYHVRVRSDDGCRMHGPGVDVSYTVYGGRDASTPLDACGKNDDSLVGIGSSTFLLRLVTGALPAALPPGDYRDDLRVEVVP